MSILAFFTALEQSWMGQTIQGSVYIFPITEVFHLLGLGVMGGTVLLVDLRMLGFGLTNHPLQQLASDVRPFMKGALALMVTSGIILFVSEATKCYSLVAFWFKMGSLLAAVIFTFTWKNRVVRNPPSPVLQKVTAVISVLLWSFVGIGGRWIGFE